LSRQQDEHAAAVFDHPYLRVEASSTEHLGAMKALVGRQHDLEDLRQLIDRLELRSPDEVLRIAADVFPDQGTTRPQAHADRRPVPAAVTAEQA
jgi:hypothetical protein